MRFRWVFAFLVVLALAGGAAWYYQSGAAPTQGTGADRRGGRGGGDQPVPVVAGTVAQQDVPIYLNGLGTVQAFNMVVVRARVDGELQKIAFTEGQDVKVGDLLAQIDPRPFQAALAQAEAKKAQDEAQLANARRDLARYTELRKQGNYATQQQLDTQRAQVDQLDALVKSDQAAIDSAKVQLGYTTITSPIEGRVGIRLVDQGNIVHAGDANGLVSLTQVQPISIVFTLPQQNLPDVNAQSAGGKLEVVALDRDNQAELARGMLAVVDNQIDQSTGTIKLKATFANENRRLWPGQFVNVRLLVTVRKNATVVPAQVVQRGPKGAFAYVVTPERTVEVRPIKVAQIDQGVALVDDGLKPGETVVVDGQSRLQPGTKVVVRDPAARDAPPTADAAPRPERGGDGAPKGQSRAQP